jgi:hypothetical protein
MQSQSTLDLNDYIQIYDQLSKQRDALVKDLELKIGLKKSDPEAYQRHQYEIRTLNRRLRMLRVRLMNAGIGV